jgi:acyl dehydratase
MVQVITGLVGMTLPLFWDEEEAKHSIFGTRIVPGRLVLLLMAGLEEQSGFWDHETMIALVGLDKVRITAPVKYGDTLRVHIEVTETRETKNPGRGIIIHESTCLNQRNEPVAETVTTHLVTRKPAE